MGGAAGASAGSGIIAASTQRPENAQPEHEQRAGATEQARRCTGADCRIRQPPEGRRCRRVYIHLFLAHVINRFCLFILVCRALRTFCIFPGTKAFRSLSGMRLRDDTATSGISCHSCQYPDVLKAENGLYQANGLHGRRRWQREPRKYLLSGGADHQCYCCETVSDGMSGMPRYIYSHLFRDGQKYCLRIYSADRREEQ